MIQLLNKHVLVDKLLPKLDYCILRWKMKS